MNKKDIIKLISKYKYIFIGEIHGSKKIPKITSKLIYSISKNNKIIFCLEIPRQAEKELYEYLNNKIKKRDFLDSLYLRDAVFDNRINDNILVMYKKLYQHNIIFKGLENYENENPYERDKNMAKMFLNIINKNPADKYVIYVGNLHILEKATKIGKFKIKPIKIYLPKNILKKSLTIQFNKNDKEKIGFDKKTNTVNYYLTMLLNFLF